MRPLAKIRPRVVPKARGQVLEIGVGTGLNAPLYDADAVETWHGIEPDPHMRRRAEPRLASLPFPTELHSAGAEDLPFPDDHFDLVDTPSTRFAAIIGAAAGMAASRRVGGALVGTAIGWGLARMVRPRQCPKCRGDAPSPVEV